MRKYYGVKVGDRLIKCRKRSTADRVRRVMSAMADLGYSGDIIPAAINNRGRHVNTIVRKLMSAKFRSSAINRQIPELLSEYDWLFKYWGKSLPKGWYNKPNTFIDDIAQESRLAFARKFIPHCELGPEQCNKPATNDFDERAATKPDSCHKRLHVALKSAHYSAMQYARSIFRHTKTESAFSDLQLSPGADVVAYLEYRGYNAMDVAHDLGIRTPWKDTTAAILTERLTYHPEIAEESLANPRVKKAIEYMTPFEAELVGRLLNGEELRSIASAQGVTYDNARQILTRMRNRQRTRERRHSAGIHCHK